MKLSRERILSLATSTASSCTQGFVATKEIKEQEGVDYFEYQFNKSIEKYKQIGNLENLDLILSREEIINIATSVASACTQGAIESKEIEDYQGTDYFWHIFTIAVSTFSKRGQEENITYTEEEITAIAELATTTCIQAVIKIGSIKEFESLECYLSTLKDTLYKYSHQAEKSKSRS